MTIEKKPYELLLRWDTEGKLCGAHVQYRHLVWDESGRPIGEVLDHALPLAIDDFPLRDILTQAQADAIAEAMRLRGVVAGLEAQLGDLQAKVTEIQSAHVSPA